MTKLVVLESIGFTFLRSFIIDTSTIINFKNYSNLINLDIIGKIKIGLESIDLQEFISLEDITSMIENIKTLKYLNLRCCTKIESIGSSMHYESSLIEIYLKDYKSLDEICKAFKNFKKLKVFKIKNYINLKLIIIKMNDLKELRILNLERSINLKEMLLRIKKLSKSKKLSFKNYKTI